MNTKTLLLLVFMAMSVESIFLMVKPKVPRCMIEYISSSTGPEPTMKVSIKFPTLQNQIPQEHFFVSFRNTQTNKTDSQAVKPGSKYQKEIEFESNILYEICVIFRTDRKEEEVMIEFDAERSYVQFESDIKVPEHLLIKEDFKQAYIAASYVVETIAAYRQEHNSRKDEEYKAFGVTQQVSQRLSIFSWIQLLVLLGAGLYQFFMLKNYLSDKQYI